MRGDRLRVHGGRRLRLRRRLGPARDLPHADRRGPGALPADRDERAARDVRWTANRRLEISNFNFKFPRA